MDLSLEGLQVTILCWIDLMPQLAVSRGDRESDFLGFRVVSGLDTISRPFPSGIGKFEIVFFGQLEVVPDF